MFQCKVCQEKFEKGYDHVMINEKSARGFTIPIIKDEAHELALDKAVMDGFSDGCPFCGSPVETHGWKDGPYEITCSGCDYLLDED